MPYMYLTNHARNVRLYITYNFISFCMGVQITYPVKELTLTENRVVGKNPDLRKINIISSGNN
jgi:hypothetical protein